MTDTPRIPLQGSVALSTVIPGVETSVAALPASGGVDISTKLLLHFNGDNGEAVFKDSSRFEHPVIVSSSNVTTSSAAVKFGNASVRFNGMPGYLQLDGSADFAFGSSNFTIDFWLRMNTIGVDSVLYDSRPITVNVGPYPLVWFRADGRVCYYTDTTNIASTNPLVVGQWYHVAVVRTGTNTTKMFVNGVQTGSTYVDNNFYLNGANRPIIGIAGVDPTLLTTTPDCWIDELRVSDIARWTQNFTPPSLAYYDDNSTIITADSDEPIVILDDDMASSVGAS